MSSTEKHTNLNVFKQNKTQRQLIIKTSESDSHCFWIHNEKRKTATCGDNWQHVEKERDDEIMKAD